MKRIDDDQELMTELRALGRVRPEPDARFWDDLAARVRADYGARARARRTLGRWRTAGAGTALALAAALVLWLRPAALPRAPLADDSIADDVVLGDEEPAEMVEQLDGADLERVSAAFDK